MSRPPKSPEDREARKRHKLTLLRQEMQRAVVQTTQKRSILKQVIDGKSMEDIATYEHLGVARTKQLVKEITQEYKENFTTEVGFWTEILMARYNKLFEFLMPLALARDAQSIGFVLEILEAMVKLTGASASDRQRQQAVDNLKRKVDGDLVVNVYDRYKTLLDAMRPGVEAHEEAAARDITVTAARNSGTEEAEEIISTALTLYRDDDGV